VSATLYHVHDPMCSWCWAFRPAWDALFDALQGGALTVVPLLGGLAPDSDVPMPEAMARQLQATWRQIQQSVPGTRFDFAFWSDNVPRRSTWIACRAVIAAEQLGVPERRMTDAIQQAYYLEARNPSDADVLIELATRLGLPEASFAAALQAPATRARFDDHRRQVQDLGVRGFPSLVLQRTDGERRPIPIDFSGPDSMLRAIAALD